MSLRHFLLLFTVIYMYNLIAIPDIFTIIIDIFSKIVRHDLDPVKKISESNWPIIPGSSPMIFNTMTI